MIDLLQLIAVLLTIGLFSGLLFIFSAVMRGIARRERNEMAQLNKQGAYHGRCI